LPIEIKEREMTTTTRKIRVLIAKTSLDGHWRGVATVAHFLSDAGMEVVYGGQLTAAQIADAAVQEDVDVIGLNIGGRFGHVRELVEMLREKGLGNRLIIAGGPIQNVDIPELKEIGVAEVFPTGAKLEDIVDYIKENVSAT